MSKREKKTAIIVEDDPVFRDSIASLIDGMGDIQLLECFGDFESAWEFITSSPPIELILLDIGLPAVDGLEGARRIKTLLPEAVIIMVTVFDDQDKIFGALTSGASGYLLKAEPPKRIISSIREALLHGGVFSPSIAGKVIEFFRKKPAKSYGLTPSEKEILHLLQEGLAKKQIADRLNRSYGTVDTHLKNIYRKLHVNSGIQAIAKAIKENLL